MARKPETKFKERVRKDLATLPRVWFVKTQQVWSRGTPDFLVCLNGYFVALELKKSGKEKPDRLQDHNLTKIRAAGGVSYVVHPDNWPELFHYMKLYSEEDDDKTDV